MLLLISEGEFENRYEAISWICLNQLGRRNLEDVQKKMLIGRKYKAEKMAFGASDGFRGNQHTKLVKEQNVPLPDGNSTADKIASELNVSHMTVKRAEKFVDGVYAADEVLPGIAKDITSGKIKPKQADVRAIAKAPVEERKQLAENLYKTPTPEEKKRQKEKRIFLKNLRSLDLSHVPSADNKITPADMLMTFQSEVEKFIDTMDFCLGYSPELLSEKRYSSEVEMSLEKLEDYIKNLKGELKK